MDFNRLKSLNWKQFWKRLTFVVSIGFSIIGFCIMFSETYSSEYLVSAVAKGLLMALLYFGYVWIWGFAVYGIIWVLNWVVAGLKKD